MPEDIKKEAIEDEDIFEETDSETDKTDEQSSEEESETPDSTDSEDNAETQEKVEHKESDDKKQHEKTHNNHDKHDRSKNKMTNKHGHEHSAHHQAHHEHHGDDDGTIKISKKTLKKVLIGLAIILVLALAVFAATKFIKLPASGGDKVKVEFYVMSQCPYGTQVEDAIAPVLKQVGHRVDFQLDFIASDLGNGNFQSLHGQNEVLGNIAQLCAIKHEPKKYMDMIVCMNENAGAIPGNWESCAQSNGLNVQKIKACYEGDEGKQLHSDSIKRSEAIQATGSPTIYIGGQEYNGGRESSNFLTAICAHIPGEPACADIPACGSASDCPAVEGKVAACENPNTKSAKCVYNDPVKVGLVVVNDEKCSSCDSSRIVEISQQLFPGVEVSYVDISSAEGKRIAADMELIYLPAYVFDERIVNTESWTANPSLASSFEKVGDSYKILDAATGATYYVSDEARAEAMAKMGVVTGDNKPQIDFFIMSYCPYGNQAEEAIEPAYQLLKGKADFLPHYVIYEQYAGGGDDYCIEDGKYCSMHGIQELNQNVREQCVNKYMGTDKYFEFILAMNEECSSSNADTCWKPVAQGLGLDTAKIEKCEAEEKLAFVKEDKRLNDIYGVSGSPTVFIDGQGYQGSRTPEGFKTGLCAAFDTMPSECSTTLEGETAASAATAGGAC